MSPLHHFSSGHVTPARLIAVAVCLTFVVTIVSVNELGQLIGQSISRDAKTLPSHTDWLAVAERAVEHVEHLPHLPQGGLHMPHLGERGWLISDMRVNTAAHPALVDIQSAAACGSSNRQAWCTT
jgi:hypothetical protein